MKKTKEINKAENIIDEILKFDSLKDAEKFEEIASGRKFCKKGERIQDICEDELENYICKNSGNILLKWYFRRKSKKNRDKLLLENRVTSVVRAVVKEVINMETETYENLGQKVKNIILDKVKEYKKQLEEGK